jgi:hypothetical protein
MNFGDYQLSDARGDRNAVRDISRMPGNILLNTCQDVMGVSYRMVAVHNALLKSFFIINRG